MVLDRFIQSQDKQRKVLEAVTSQKRVCSSATPGSRDISSAPQIAKCMEALLSK